MSSRRRVLMVAFHFPPIASSAGALRSRAFADYLPAHGWEPHVLTPVETVYEAMDTGMSIPAHARVHRAWALDVRRDLGWRGRYPSIAATPDRWSSWTPAAVKKGLAVVRDCSIDVLWSTYPIPTSHLVAGLIARCTGLPWIAEFRDPVQFSGGRIQRSTQRALERYVFRHSDCLVFVTEGARRSAVARFPEAANRMYVIPNGYDEAVESTCTTNPKRLLGVEPIVLVHSGHLYPDGRNPTRLLEAIAQLKTRGHINGKSLQIVFRNSQQGDWVAPKIRELDIGDIVKLARRLPHAEAVMEQREAHGLILLQGKEFNDQIPAKLFEYMRSGRPTLALVHSAGDTAALLRELNAGLLANPESVDEIAVALVTLVSRLSEKPKNNCLWQPDLEQLRRYSRREQTRELANLFEYVIGKTESCSSQSH